MVSRPFRKFSKNKKVLLRERIASTRYTALSNGGGGYPGYTSTLDRARVTPHPKDRVPPRIQTWPGYPPPPRHGWGSPPPQGWSTPQNPDLARVSPPCRPYWGTLPHHPDLAGVPPPPPTIQTWPGYTPPSIPGQGTPSPRPGIGYPPQVWTDIQTRVKTLPSLVLSTWAVIKGQRALSR